MSEANIQQVTTPPPASSLFSRQCLSGSGGIHQRLGLLVHLVLPVFWVALFLYPVADAAAQPLLPRDYNGHVTYRGYVAMPGLTRRQVLARAVRYANSHLISDHISEVAPWLVDSTNAVVSGARRGAGHYALHCEILLQAESGGCSYEISDLATMLSAMSSPVVPGAGLRTANRYVSVEATLDQPGQYNRHHQPTPALRAYCAEVMKEMDVTVTQLHLSLP